MTLFEKLIHNKPEERELPTCNPLSIQEQEQTIYACAGGNAVDLSECGVPVFSSGLAGNGVMIETEDEILYAPVTGTISMVFSQGTAFGITDEQGRDLLIHLGEKIPHTHSSPFTSYVMEKQEVKAGDPILKVDWKKLDECERKVFLILTGKEKISILNSQVQAGDPLIEIMDSAA